MMQLTPEGRLHEKPWVEAAPMLCKTHQKTLKVVLNRDKDPYQVLRDIEDAHPEDHWDSFDHTCAENCKPGMKEEGEVWHNAWAWSIPLLVKGLIVIIHDKELETLHLPPFGLVDKDISIAVIQRQSPSEFARMSSKEEEKRKELINAQNEIEQDPNVQSLVEAFGAKIIESSIEPRSEK